MKELPSFDFGKAGSGEDTGSSSDEEKKDSKKSKSSKARAIGGFAKSSAETTPTHPDRKEVKKSLFGIEGKKGESLNKDLVGEKSKSENKKADPEATAAENEPPEVVKLKNEQLQGEIQNRINTQDEVIATAPQGSAERIQAEQSRAFELSLQEKAIDPSLDADPVIEAEYARQLAEIKLEDTSAEVADAEQTLSEELENTDVDVADDEVELPDTIESTITDSQGEDDSQEPFATTAASPPPLPVPPTPTTSSRRTQPATPTPPSPPPRPPAPPVITPSRQPEIGGNTTVPPRFNPNVAPTMPAPSNPNVLTTPTTGSNERSRKTGAFLLGGLFGYMIGRRGGRKRAEAKLKPEISSLDTELANTKKHLEKREQDLKTAATVHLREQPASPPKQPEAQTERPKVATPEKTTMTPTPKPAREIIRQAVATPEEVPESTPPAQIEETEVSMPISPASAERPKPKLQPIEAGKRVEQLSTPELLKTASSIYIDGTSVKKLYEINRIDRKGLVAIVKEAARGGNLTRVLERVELGRERQVERAHEFRHDNQSFTMSSGSSSSTTPSSAPVQPLPNNPDTSSVQPLRPINASNQTINLPQFDEQDESTPSQKIKLNPKTTEFKLAATAAVFIALLILWVIFG